MAASQTLAPRSTVYATVTYGQLEHTQTHDAQPTKVKRWQGKRKPLER
jgi:hypothetical protein